jgi:hypothetical protein
MPHVVLMGKIPIEDMFNRLSSLFIRNGPKILRTMDVYLERGKSAILIESLAIETGVKRQFLSMISGRDDGVVVRLYPQMEVEKTDGVKQILAEIAKQLKLTFPELHVGETNLDEYLK